MSSDEITYTGYTTTGYRVQSADRDVADLLDTDQCWTISWNNGDEQYGISVCYSLDELAEYLATQGECIPVQAGWNIVHLSGREIAATGHDDETLVEPEEILSVTTVTQEWIDQIDSMCAPY